MKDGRFVILCVDDDADVLATLRAVLEREGYSVIAAADTAEAIARVEEVSPDLFIVDLMMEQVDSGTSLVAQLRAQGNKAPIYMLSAVGDGLANNIDCCSLGLDGVFQKPVNSAYLLTTVRAHLRM